MIRPSPWTPRGGWSVGDRKPGGKPNGWPVNINMTVWHRDLGEEKLRKMMNANKLEKGHFLLENHMIRFNKISD